MNSENRAKIREALVSLSHCDFSPWVRDIASEALSILDSGNKPIPEPAPADQGEELADPQNEASNDDWDEFDSMEDWADWNSTGLYNGLFCLTKWPKDKNDKTIAQLDMIYEYTMRVMSRALAARPHAEAQESEGDREARDAAWLKCRAEREPIEGSDDWTVGEVGIYRGFFNLAARLAQSPTQSAEGLREAVEAWKKIAKRYTP